MVWDDGNTSSPPPPNMVLVYFLWGALMERLLRNCGCEYVSQIKV